VALLYGIGFVILLGTTGLAVFTAGWGIPPAWAAAATTVVGRAVISAIGAATCGAVLMLAIALADWLAASRALRRPGPKGEIAIAPKAVKQLAAGLLRRELGLSGFKIGLVSASDGVYLKITLPLPHEEEAPRLAERIQELLSREIEAKTGLPVLEVDLVIRGTARPATSETS
jgi:uncharacterized alkaline shock family protein YloU